MSPKEHPVAISTWSALVQAIEGLVGFKDGRRYPIVWSKTCLRFCWTKKKCWMISCHMTDPPWNLQCQACSKPNQLKLNQAANTIRWVSSRVQPGNLLISFSFSTRHFLNLFFIKARHIRSYFPKKKRQIERAWYIQTKKLEPSLFLYFVCPNLFAFQVPNPSLDFVKFLESCFLYI